MNLIIVTLVSYNTCIRDIEPIEIKGDIFKLAVESEDKKGIIESRYKNVIQASLLLVTDKRFELEFFV